MCSAAAGHRIHCIAEGQLYSNVVSLFAWFNGVVPLVFVPGLCRSKTQRDRGRLVL